MKTAITEMFGVEVPIFAFSHCRDVVAEVTKAGGVGVLGAVAHSPEGLETDLAWVTEQVGDRPFGVDLIVPAEYAGSDEGGLSLGRVRRMIPSEHVEFVDDLLRRYDVPPLAADDGPGGGVGGGSGGGGESGGDSGFGGGDDSAAAPMSAESQEPNLDIALAYPTAIIVNALGPPPRHMIERCRQEGRKVGALAGKAQHAERHVATGVDVVIAQGSEAGGHTGEIASMVLIPEIVDAVGDTPVLGAGGIGRGRQMAAAMALGAQGVWCGSVWLTTLEAETHPAVKQKFLDATSSDTIRSRSRTGKPARQLRSAWTEEWENPDTPMPLGMPMQPVLVEEAIRRINRCAHREGSGAQRLANYFVGQIVGHMNESKSAAGVVFEMIEEFIEAVENLNAQLHGDRATTRG